MLIMDSIFFFNIYTDLLTQTHTFTYLFIHLLHSYTLKSIKNIKNEWIYKKDSCIMQYLLTALYLKIKKKNFIFQGWK